MTREVVVIGGSLVGLSAALAMSRVGIRVTVLERSPRFVPLCWRRPRRRPFAPTAGDRSQ